MRCMVCGREAMNPEANFCDYCGSSFRECNRESADSDSSVRKAEDGDGYSAFGTEAFDDRSIGAREKISGEKEGTKDTIWTYLGAFFLPMVPMVGVFLWLFMMFSWAAGSKVNESRRCFARAYLIFIGVSLMVLYAYVGTMK